MQLKKCAKSLSCAKNSKKLFTIMGGKYKLSTQYCDLAHFFEPQRTFWQKAAPLNLILVCIWFMFSDTNPNYFSDRDQSCGNVRLDYTIHTWESPNPAVAAQSRTKTASSSSDSGKEIKNSIGYAI